MTKTLIVLVGCQGAGKTTYCAESLKGYLRISQDDQGKDHLKIFSKAVEDGEPYIVIDRINADKTQRHRYLAPAKAAGYHTKIVWLNVDRAICEKRCLERRNHPTLKPDKAATAIEYYFKNFQTPSRMEADEICVIGDAPYYTPVADVRERIGDRRYIIVGDIHGCLDELQQMLAELSFRPEEDVLVSAGDLVDRGPKVKETLEYVMSLPRFHAVKGNHDDKAVRYFEGHKKMKLTNGLLRTVEQYGDAGMPKATVDWLRKLPCILRVPDGYVVHAGFDPTALPEEQTKSDCLFMRYHGGASYFDDQGGILWYRLWPKSAPRVFFGHIPDMADLVMSNVISLDGGCVFGDYLKAWDSRDGKVHYVKAKEAYSASEYGKAVGNAHESVRRREEYAVAGLLRFDRSDDGKLTVYTYTDQCVFARAWDDVTRNSRGHIYHMETGECVAWAIPKFFNLNENEEVQFKDLPWDKPYEVFEKEDGWLGVLYRQDGRFKVASRGSFHSPGATWATEFIQRRDMTFLPEDVTLIFEIITPEQKIILDYKGLATLVVLCAFNRRTGEEYPRFMVEEWAQKAALPVVRRYDGLTIHDCVAMQAAVKDREGFVIRLHDGRRVKVKMEWYMQIAKVMAGMSPITTWESMKRGKVPNDYLASLPEELRPMAEMYKSTLEGQYAAVADGIKTAALALAKRFAGDKKKLALHMQAEGTPSEVRTAAFAASDSKRDVDEVIERVVMDRIYPKSNEFQAV